MKTIRPTWFKGLLILLAIWGVYLGGWTTYEILNIRDNALLDLLNALSYYHDGDIFHAILLGLWVSMLILFSAIIWFAAAVALARLLAWGYYKTKGLKPASKDKMRTMAKRPFWIAGIAIGITMAAIIVWVGGRSFSGTVPLFEGPSGAGPIFALFMLLFQSFFLATWLGISVIEGILFPILLRFSISTILYIQKGGISPEQPPDSITT